MLHFVLGDKASGKTTEMIHIARSVDRTEQVFFIVPEQSTLSVQKRLLDDEAPCLFNIEVLSFNRLAHRVFEEVGEPKGASVDDVGKSLVLYRVCKEMEGELAFYKNCLKKPGFLGRMKLFLTEVEQYKLEDGKLFPAEKPTAPTVLEQKLMDIQKIYDHYVAYLSNKGLYNAEHILDDLTVKIKDSELCKNATFVLDGFSGFTPQQFNVIQQMLSVGKDVYISLTIPEEEYDKVKHIDIRNLSNGRYHETLKTLKKLESLGSLGSQKPFFAKHEPASVVVFQKEHADFESEMDAVLKEILRLVREENYRFRDMALLVPGVEEKAHYIARRMEEYQISFHMNRTNSLNMHPISQLVFQSIRMILSGFETDSVLAFLKTGFTKLLPEHLNVFELEVKERELHGFASLEKVFKKHETEWPEAKEIPAQILSFKRSITENEQIIVREFFEALDAFFEALGVSEQREEKGRILDALAQDANRTQNPALESQYRRAAEEYSACWNVYENTKAQMLKHMGDEKLSLEDIFDSFKIGFSQSAVHVVPSSLDALEIGDVSSPYLDSVKALFVIGLSEANYPGDGTNPGLFSQKERAELKEKVEIAPDAIESVELKYFNLYSILGKATEKIYLSTPKVSPDGRSTRPCLIWQALKEKEYIPNATLAEWPETIDFTLPIPFLMEHGYEEIKNCPNVTDFLKKEHKALLEQMEQANIDKLPTDKIKRETAQALFDQAQGQQYSVSKLESYARCPYQFFLNYGLNVQSPKDESITNLENGTLLHAIFEEAKALLQKVIEENVNVDTIDFKAESEECFLNASQKQNVQEGLEIYQANETNKYYLGQLKRETEEMLSNLTVRAQHSDFKPEAVEWGFKGYELKDLDGNAFTLTGKVDRIDMAEINGNRYVTVYDYKTSGKSFKKEDPHDGLTLQLPIYLDVVCDTFTKEKNQETKPAGFLYYSLYPNAEAAEDDKKRVSGRILDDLAVIQALDNSKALGKIDDVEAEVFSPVYIPVSYNAIKTKGGIPQYTLSGKSKNHISEDELKKIGEEAKEYAAKAVAKIREGEVPIMPFSKKEEDTNETSLQCKYCVYKGTCGLDKRLNFDTRHSDYKENHPEEYAKKEDKKK